MFVPFINKTERSSEIDTIGVVGVVVVLNCHSNEQEAKLFYFLEEWFVFDIFLCYKALSDQCHIGLVNIKCRDKIKLKLKKFQKFFLSPQDLFLAEGIVGYLL